MAGDNKFDWRLCLAASAALGIVLLLSLEAARGGSAIYFFIMLTGYCAGALLLLYIMWRAMRAHERLADAVEKLAQHQEKVP